MNVGFEFNDPQDGASSKVYFEQIFAEKPAGGLVANPAYTIQPATAVYLDSTTGLYLPIKGYRLAAAVAKADTTIKVEKGSGVAVGDIIGNGTKAVECTAVDAETSTEYDIVTVTMGVAIANGTVLFEAASASDDAAAPKATPVFVTGGKVHAGKGDKRVRLINGANLRKATANIADEVAALMPQITLV